MKHAWITALILALPLLLAAPLAAQDAATDPQAQKLTQAWQKMLLKVDTDKDGTLSKAEVEQSGSGFARMDHNGDGVVTNEDVPQWAKAAQGPRAMRAKKALRQRLKTMDTNGDGKITQEEWNAKKMTIFAKVDGNGDGKITQEEFEAAGKAAMQLARMAMSSGQGA